MRRRRTWAPHLLRDRRGSSEAKLVVSPRGPRGLCVTPSEGGTSPQISRGSRFGRLAAIGALVLAVIAIAVVFLGGGDDGSKYRLLFETGGQLVKGNQVLIGGAPVGTVDEIELRDDGAGRGVHHHRPGAPPGHLRGDPLDLAIRSREPLHLDHARPRQPPGARRRRADHPGRHHHPGRPRPALQRDPRARAQGPSGHHPGVRHRLRGPQRGGQRDLSLPEPVTHRHHPSDRRAQPPTSASSATSSSAARGSSRRSASAATTSPS